MQTYDKTGNFTAAGDDGRDYLIFEYTRINKVIAPSGETSWVPDPRVCRLINGTRVIETDVGVFLIKRTGVKLVRLP